MKLSLTILEMSEINEEINEYLLSIHKSNLFQYFVETW